MTDSTTTTAPGPILDQIAGDYWSWRQLDSGIKDLSIASGLIKSLTIMGVVFLSALVLPQLEVRFLHVSEADSGSDCGRLLALRPASEWDKVISPSTLIHEVTGSQVEVESMAG